MKQVIFLLFLSLAFTSLKSQNKWSLGPTINLGFSGEQQKSDTNYDYGPGVFVSELNSKVQPSFGIGFSVERYFGKRWGINIGIQYNFLQRYDFTTETNQPKTGIFTTAYYASNKISLIAHQLQAPLQARFYFGKKRSFRPFLSAGGIGTYTISAKQDNQYTWSSSRIVSQSIDSFSYDFDEDWSAIKRFGLTKIVGLGIDFGIFSFEINRIQSVLKQGGYYDTRLVDVNSYLPFASKKLHSTMMTIKYKL